MSSVPFDEQVEVLARYDRQVPRYTSYPTAPQFGPQVDAATAEAWVRELPARLGQGEAVSLYLHLPYCKSLCFYCGCNMKVTNHLETIGSYVDVLIREIDRVVGMLGTCLPVSCVHLGGGTPTYAPAGALLKLTRALRERFALMPEAEYSVEIDPRLMTAEVAAELAACGITRASLGVQDTDAAVQKAIHRIQPLDQTQQVVRQLRDVGIGAINFDLLYGLPLQSAATMRQTIADVMTCAPDRLAIFGYAHVPWMKKHQVVLEQHGLPDGRARAEILLTAASLLQREGYVGIGIDHFARAEDPLTLAVAKRGIQRNFMGYTTDSSQVLLGFGASAISQYAGGYCQNITAVGDYIDAVKAGGLPVARGVAFQPQDGIIRRLIGEVMCYGEVDLARFFEHPALNDAWKQASLARVDELVADGLVVREGLALRMTPVGLPLVRLLAACFDEYIGVGRYSRAA